MLKANFLFAISSAARSAAGEARRMLAKPANRVKVDFALCQRAGQPFHAPTIAVYAPNEIYRPGLPGAARKRAQ